MAKNNVVYDFFNVPPKVKLNCKDLSRTQQQFLQESDINYIVRKYADTENFVDPSVPVRRTPVYGDFSECPSFQEHQDALNNIVNIFDNFPSDIRARFDNNPAVFAEYASDIRNLDKLAELGLIDRKLENVNNGVDINKVTSEERSSDNAKD